jgi:SAM-dependent methyltransferase
MPQFYDDTLTRALTRSVKRGPQMRDSVEIAPAEMRTYGREHYADSWAFGTRKDWLTGYGLDNNANVLVIGCGFGFLIEELAAAGITDVYGLDPGPFYWDAAQAAEWDVSVKARVAQDWVGSGTEKASLNALGVTGQAKFTFVVDEDAVPMHSDAELPAFIAGCEARLQGNARGRIVHLVTTVGPYGPENQAVNWKTLAEWKAVEPAHTWVDINTGVVG